MASLIDALDAQLAALLAGWNSTTTLLALAIAIFIGYSAYLNLSDPDIHPMLLARSSNAAAVRQPGESAVYRSPQVPHGYPLQASLNIPGEQRYQRRAGDLRDIWRKVAGVLPGEKGELIKHPGKILTVLGKDEVVDHEVEDVSREINVLGGFFKQHVAKRVGVYMPNSIEFMVTVFAGAFYGFSPILIPYNQPHDVVISILQRSKADCLVAEAGSIPLADVTKYVSGLKQIVWVVEKTSRHMDWNDVPEGAGGKIDVSTWHDLMQDSRATSTTEVPKYVAGDKAESVYTVWQNRMGGEGEIVEFTQENLTSAVASLIAALPSTQRFNPSDLFLPAESLTQSYTLCQTFAALYSHASLALTSVAGAGVQFNLAARGIAPTVACISAETAADLHANTTATLGSGLKKIAHSMETRAWTSGRMPTNTLLTKLNAPTRAAVGATPGKLRLVFIAEKAGADTPPLSSTDLSDLRVFLNARVIYALTAAKVAGAIAQTNIYDYRREEGLPSKHAHFGAPLSSVEIKLVDTESAKTTEERVEGGIVVMGPAVAGGSAEIGAVGKFRDDGCLAYF